MLNFALGIGHFSLERKTLDEPDIVVERRAHRSDELAYRPACGICLADFEILLADHWANLQARSQPAKAGGLFNEERSSPIETSLTLLRA